MSLGRYTRDARDFVTVTPFEWRGVDYAEGATFPAIALGLDEMQRRSLWVANKIAPVAPVAPDPAPAAPPTEAPKPRRGRG